MPSLPFYDRENLDQLNKLAAEEATTRRMEIEQRQAYYEGDMRKWLVDPKTKKPVAENVTINLTQKVIDQTVSMLFGGGIRVETGNETTAALVEAIEDKNFDDAFYTSLVGAGSIAGHCYVKILPTDSGIRWVMLNPALVTVFWKPDDLKTTAAYKIQWVDGEVEYRQDVVKMEGVNMQPFWLIRDMRRQKRGDWTIMAEIEWRYPFAPIVDWQNLPNMLGYYGKSDLTALPINDAINFVASNVNMILKHHAHPKTIGTGLRADAIKESAVNGFYAIENEAAKVFNLEMQSDLQSSMSYMSFLRNEFFSQQRSVDIQSVKDKVGQLTNFGLRVLYSDAIGKNEIKQLLYGYGIKELIYRSLIVAGASIEAQDINVEFDDPMPVNDLENADRIKTQIESGIISKATGSEELGYDWVEESKQMALERDAQTVNLGAALMNAMRQTDGDNGATA